MESFDNASWRVNDGVIIQADAIIDFGVLIKIMLRNPPGKNKKYSLIYIQVLMNMKDNNKKI